MCSVKKYVVPEAFDGIRLDKVLVEMLPESSLRLRRRLCDEKSVLVDGCARNPGYKVCRDQQVEISVGGSMMSVQELGLSVVKQEGMFGAVFKPGGVHSASIAGKDTQSVEAVLPELFPNDSPVLLNRLDYGTSGLLLVAMTSAGKKTYRELEDAGQIKKFYIAKVKGRLDGVITIKSKLDTDDRKKTRVLDEVDTDSRRWTDVDTQDHDHSSDTSTVRCLIMKGARHQIRVHLASIGHPIVGDCLYGDGAKGDSLRLHHERVELPDFVAEVSF